MSADRPLEPLLLLSDEPIDGESPDDLGRDDDARLLAELVLGTRGPFTIGLYGNWGTGKTSLLNRVRRLLEVKDGDRFRYPYIVPVFFNAWQYERETEPLAHLTAAIHDAVAARLKALQSRTDAVREKAIEWLRSVHLSARASIYGVSIDGGPAAALGVKFSSKEAIDRYEKLIQEQGDQKSRAWKKHVEDSATIAALRSMRADDSLLDKVTAESAKHIPRVVVFIDDMDRCSPKDAFHILRGIKLALAQPGFVFLLSLNPDTLKPYIAEEARAANRIAPDSTEAIYLDKLVQLPYPLRLRNEQWSHYAKTLVEERISGVVSENEHKIFIQLLPSLRDSSDRNPRTLKRRINAVIVDARLAPDTLEAIPKPRIHGLPGRE